MALVSCAAYEVGCRGRRSARASQLDEPRPCIRAPRRRAAALRRAGKTCGRGLPPWAAQGGRRSSSRTVPRHRRSAAPWKKGYRSTVPRQIGDLADIPAMDPARGSEAQRAIRRMSDRRDGDVHSSWIDGQRFCPKPFRDKILIVSHPALHLAQPSSFVRRSLFITSATEPVPRLYPHRLDRTIYI